MKAIKIFTIILLTTGLLPGRVHDYSVPKIEGGNLALSAFQGKKFLILTLPIIQTASADSMLYSLDTLASARRESLAIIAVPAYEDGFTDSLKLSLQQWYRSKLGSYIIITDGLYTRKTSGVHQHPLFKWLTTLTENEVFDIDVEGPGFKFFAGVLGDLHSVIRPQTKIYSNAVQRALRL